MPRKVWSFLMSPGFTLAFVTAVMLFCATREHHGLAAAVMLMVATLVPRVHVMGWPYPRASTPSLRKSRPFGIKHCQWAALLSFFVAGAEARYALQAPRKVKLIRCPVAGQVGLVADILYSPCFFP